MDSVAGYRLVRRLGEGDRAEVWLGHAGSNAAVAALKVYRPGTSRASIDTELEALARCSSPHVLELQDVGSAPDGRPCLILPRLAGPSLAGLMAERDRFAVGELVTALAPVAIALAELHRVGVGHGAVVAAAVLLDTRGAPVIARFGNAAVVGEPPDGGRPSLTIAQRSEDPRLLSDRVQFAELTAEFGARTPGAEAFVRWAVDSIDVDEFFEQAAERLFDLATGMPIGRAVERDPMPASIPRTVEVPQFDAESLTPGRWLGLLEKNPVSAIVGRVRSMLSTVRRPVWVVGSIGLGAMVVGFAVIPGIGHPDGARSTPAMTASSAPAPPSPMPTSSALTGDDPVAAAQALIAGRAWCFTRLSAGCLADIDQAGSAALDADDYFLRELQGGGTVKDRALDAGSVALVQRIGDTAIVGLGTPVQGAIYPQSVLLVRLDVGWRIRDLTTGASQ